ncbi:mitotic checkpoint regulator, MAD2B-interacting-domain-containing protein [Whalleya microplaca]|nr:mitotic checkpoint regulator, MAD2B-interacting-domain-containing protein [Whalleya microplaca]
MGLVDYSDSESDSEPVAKPAAPAPQAAGGKKPFQKVVDRSKPGKILVNLPSSNRDETKDTNSDEPPAKRARTAGGRGGAFSGFNSFLPPPKNVGKPAAGKSTGKTAPRAGISLKTGAAPGFSREVDGADEEGADTTSAGKGGMDLPAPKSQQPSIPAEQKPAEEVKLVGKPLMFKPLSVSRKPTKKNIAKSTTVAKTTITTTDVVTPATPATQANEASQPKEVAPPAKKKISLFSISDEPADDEPSESPSSNGAYEPMFTDDAPSSTAADFAAYDAQFATSSTPASAFAPPPESQSLDAIASDMNLSAAARRELFGRSGAPGPDAAQARVLSFDTDREYAHNEALRAAGDTQAFNPVRAIAPGKHSLRQLVSQVHNQREALEDSFAKGKSNRSEAGARYGWR